MEKDSRYKCNYCEKVFSKSSNRTRHLKSVHQKNLHGEDVERPLFTCVLCNKGYTCKASLQYHVDSIHLSIARINKCEHCNYETKHRSSLFSHKSKCKSKTFGNNGKECKNKKFSCSQCSKSYSHKQTLRKHERNSHNVNRPSFHRKCPLCRFISTPPTKNEIYEHFGKAHGIQMKWEKHTFPNTTEFVDWKEQLQQETSSTFIKTACWKQDSMSFTCNRSGYYNAKGANKRNIKIAGTCKINAFCPAEIRVKINESGAVSVLYMPTHVGHKNDLKYMRLQADDKKFIVSQLLSKIPRDEILNKARQSFKSNNKLKKIHLLTKKDITNIEKSFNINSESVKHNFDPASIDVWVHELKLDSNTALLAYKPQGMCDGKYPELNKQDVLLIYMTEAQKSLLMSFGWNILSLDKTHAVNYNFYLYTLLALDDGHEGIPCAFMFTNRSDELTLSLFFQSIKDVAGLMIPKVFISDVDETFYSAWSKIMGPAGLRIFCTWHVLKAWRINLNKIKNKEKRENTYEILKTILYELDCNTFHQILMTALNKLQSDPDTKDYFDYFNDHYVKNEKFKCWAYCYRTNSGINTNMSLVNFNNLLTSCYLGKKVQQLDKTLYEIFNLLKDKLCDYLNKVEKGKLVSEVQALRQRHKRSMLIPKGNVTRDGDKWLVVSALGSPSTELYCVKKVQQCRRCQLQCSHCNSCFHEYMCTCVDNSIKNNMCIHIHAVCRTLKEEHKEKEEESSWLLMDAEEGENDTNIENIVIKEVKSIELSDASKRREIDIMFRQLKESAVTSQEKDIVLTGLKEILATLNALKGSSLGRPILLEYDDLVRWNIK